MYRAEPQPRILPAATISDAEEVAAEADGALRPHGRYPPSGRYPDSGRYPPNTDTTPDNWITTVQEPEEAVRSLQPGAGYAWKRVGRRWEVARSVQETTTREDCEEKEEREGVLNEEKKRTGEAHEGPKEAGTGPEERWEVVGGRWQLRRQLDSSVGAHNSSSTPTVIPKKIVWLEKAVEEGLPGLRDESKWPAADDNDLDLFMTTNDDSDGGDISSSGGGKWKQVVGTTDQWEVQRRDTRAVPAWSSNGAAEEDDEGAAAWEPSRQPQPPARSGRFFKEDERRADLADNIIEDRRIKPGKNKGDEEAEEENSEENEEKKPPKLNVSDKDSPYALLDKYFPERESYFYQNRHSFKNLHREGGGGGRAPEIGNLQPKEVNTSY